MNKKWIKDVFALVFKRSEYYETIRSEKKATIDKLQHEFNVKMGYLMQDREFSHIGVTNKNLPVIEILHVPSSFIDMQSQYAYIESNKKRSVKIMHCQLSDIRCPLDVFKREIAYEFSNKLIETGMIQNKLDDNGNIVFYVNYF